ncbi:cox cluster protein [Halorientalis brevis]|uniref:Cox cluster protein n=1 Tax=Halorientalis brevis TaxID=1126241 RepID=A0ABD6CBN6_9EURY|nr:cox cluster protein [Halorientalis brevis]
MTDADTTSGSRVVLTVFTVVVLIAGVMGTILGAIRPEDLDPELFGIIQLPPTPLGTALFGMITVGVGLGALIGAVVYISNRYDADAVE